MKITGYIVNTFAKTKEGGNGAGVVLDADHLTEREMKKIAAYVGLSETAFVMKSGNADFQVRFFTPNQEVDLCGHATIGTFFVLPKLGQIQPGKYTQQTKAGILNVEVFEDLTVMMQQTLPVFYKYLDPAEIADSLNIAVEDISGDMPIQIVSTGLKDIFIPISSKEVLNSIDPDFEKIKKISHKYDVVGYHLFSLETINNANAHCRNFAPLCGIPEESATGTSNGALACYLYKYGKIGHEQLQNIVIEQGYSMQKPSEILVSLTAIQNKITGVNVGGKSLNLSKIDIDV